MTPTARAAPLAAGRARVTLTAMDSLRPTHDDAQDEDHVVSLREVSWADYQRLLAMRGEARSPRIAYLDGQAHLLKPCRSHGVLASRIGQLVEAYCLDHGLRFEAVGAWTLKEQPREAGVEPDECFIFGDMAKDRPDLAIEVAWKGALDKLSIYRRLGVREVWVWKRGTLAVHVLRRGRYVVEPKSLALPDLDIELLASCLDRPSAYDAIGDFCAALAARP